VTERLSLCNLYHQWSTDDFNVKTLQAQTTNREASWAGFFDEYTDGVANSQQRLTPASYMLVNYARVLLSVSHTHQIGNGKIL